MEHKKDKTTNTKTPSNILLKLTSLGKLKFLTMEEKGVRNLKRCIETIYSKLNLFRLMTPGTNLFETEISLKVEFPFKVTPDIVSKLLKSPERSTSASHMYL
jgi:hypothetical protein